MSILGKSEEYDFKPLWKILPEGLTTVKLFDGYLCLDLPVQLDKLQGLCIHGVAMADLRDTSKSDKVPASSIF